MLEKRENSPARTVQKGTGQVMPSPLTHRDSSGSSAGSRGPQPAPQGQPLLQAQGNALMRPLPPLPHSQELQSGLSSNTSPPFIHNNCRSCTLNQGQSSLYHTSVLTATAAAAALAAEDPSPLPRGSPFSRLRAMPLCVPFPPGSRPAAPEWTEPRCQCSWSLPPGSAGPRRP